ncbi:catA, catalase [Hypoxylon cercidicola]|nr:catA, catalase [Hypoxylon cercidicola]
MNGAPVQRPVADQRIGNQLAGTLLLQDINLLELIQHLTHERIPERLVHARGFNAYGHFKVTDDITMHTSAAFLCKVGKKTPLCARFSTVAGERGSAETVRDTRGFAFKLRTEEGILDWLFLSTPVFAIRDGAKFPSFTHATKQNPQSGLPDHTMFWDYFNSNQEGIHFLMFLFSDRATPKGFQYAECFSIHTYRFTTKDGKYKYVKIRVEPSQGVKNFNAEEAQAKAGQDPDYLTRSAKEYAIDIFDPTKTIPEDKFPFIKFGEIVLDKNVDNFFAESEQSAFSPTNLVPGWALTPDPILQTRCLAYADAQRYRLGTNFIQLPVNKPDKSHNPMVRDGAANFNNLDSTPNYYPSTVITPGEATQYAVPDTEMWNGRVEAQQSMVVDKDYEQARNLWQKVLTADEKTNFVSNVAGHLSVAAKTVHHATYDMFRKVDKDLAKRIEDEVNKVEMSKLAKNVQGINIADSKAKKQSVHNDFPNFNLIADKKMN